MFAQDRATLTGTVTDPSGAAIPNATVKVTNTANNETSETKASSSGVYTIPYLNPGVYNVEVSAAGFQALRRQAITLETGQRLNLPVQMTVGQATTEVTVTGQQEVVDSGDANKGLVFDPIKTQEYPLNGRQAYMLLSLTPGVIFTQEQFGASGFSGTRGWDVNSSYKFNGARAGNGNNVFMMNGSPISDNGSQWDLAPNVDAIQEFSAITTAYDAQYGHEAGGVVNFNLKAGTNNWHGDVYDYFRNRVLDANNFVNNYGGLPKGRHNQNEFGGVFGGPIRKDKDFLFASYEGWQEVVPFPGSGVTTVPLDVRSGNFSNPAYQMQIYDPMTTHACGASTEPCSQSAYWRNPFPGNIIPQNRIDPVASKLLSYLPAPNIPGQGVGGLTNNYLNATNEGRYWYNTPIIRWDHVFSEKDKFYAIYSYFHGYEYRSSTTFPKPIAYGNNDNNRTFNGVNLDETHVISPTMFLDVRANFFRFVQLSPGYNTAAQAITPQSVGITGITDAPTVSTQQIPNISIGNITGPLFGSGSYSWSPYNSWDFTPSVTWTKGKHTIHFGFEMHYEAKGTVNPGNAFGSLTFTSTLTRQATDRSLTTNDGFDSIATLLLGIPTAGSIDNNATSYFTREYYGGYIHDDWKVTNRLTLNIGLRYDVQLPYLERYNRQISAFNTNVVNPLSGQILAQWNADAASYNANPANIAAGYTYPAAPSAIYGGYQFAGQNGLPRRQNYTDWTNGAPRIGFAFRANDKTIIRGGFGVFYQSLTQNGNSQTGFSLTTSYQTNVASPLTPSACDNGGCANGYPTGPYSFNNLFPQGIAAASGSSAGLLTNLGNGSSAPSISYKVPRTYQYSLGIQRQLPKNMVIDISFAGNYAGMTQTSEDIGWPNSAAGLQLLAQGIANPTFFSRTVPNPFLGILPASTGRGSAATVSAVSLMNAYPLWGGGTGSGGVSDNNIALQTFRSDAGQLKFEKRAFADANSAVGVFTFVYSFTFGKELSLLCCNAYNWETNATANLVSNNGVYTLSAPIPESGLAPQLRYQVDSNNKTQEHAFSGVWDLPIGKGRRFGAGATGAADKILTGWRADYIFSYISGFPVGLPNLINYCGQWANGSAQNQFAWFNNNPSCYATFPTNTGTFSGLPPRFSGNVNNPAAPQLNIAIVKETKFKEHYNLMFRAESFNITNTPIRPGPSTSFPSATFGQLPENQNNFPRLVQLALKLYF
jgi:hypothetical protein